MFKASLLTLAILLVLGGASPAHASGVDEWSSVKRTTHHGQYKGHRTARGGYAQPGQAGEPGHDVCRGDAIRLCKPVLGQGNMAVLGCFRSHASRLSRGCRALLASYGQL